MFRSLNSNCKGWNRQMLFCTSGSERFRGGETSSVAMFETQVPFSSRVSFSVHDKISFEVSF